MGVQIVITSNHYGEKVKWINVRMKNGLWVKVRHKGMYFETA